MNLKKFEKKRERVQSDIPCISISGRSGLMSFNVAMSQRLDLKAGDTVAFYQDEEKMIDWFLKKEIGDNTFKIRAYKKGLSISCTHLARKMLSSMVGGDKTRQTAKFVVSGKPYEGYHAILAHSKK